jgi:hypothetical protein
MGNPSWHYGYGRQGLTIFIEHGKNDRRESREFYKVSIDVPDGALVKLLLAHVREGHKLLTHHLPEQQHNLFVTGPGKSFNNVTFTQYWGKLMRAARNRYSLQYFPPSLARTIFIENYVACNGREPELLDGAAAIMGNTAAQWQKSYNPSRKRRAAAMAVLQHEQATQGWRDGEPSEVQLGQQEQGVGDEGREYEEVGDDDDQEEDAYAGLQEGEAWGITMADSEELSWGEGRMEHDVDD